MRTEITIGLIGDCSAAVPAHRAIPLALKSSAAALDIEVQYEWIPTDAISTAARFSRFDGLWCVPGSPYRSMDGALVAIRHARETGLPFIGTCAGFQHAVIEYARNVMNWDDAEHAESVPNASRAVISPLACGLLEQAGKVRVVPGTRVAAAYGSAETTEEYLCRYGLNPEFRASLFGGPLNIGAEDESGDVRAIELRDHPFFVATLFQPERAALKDHKVPLAVAFVRACVIQSRR